MARAIVSLVVVGLLVGCNGSSSGGDGAPGRDGPVGIEGLTPGDKPCPPKGLGVETAGGRPCSSITDVNDPDLDDCLGQMSNYRDYDCSEPQICPDTGYVAIPEQVIGAAGREVTITLTNCSTGGKTLTIARTEMEGDPRCSFAYDPQKDLSVTAVGPGQSATLRAVYAPLAEGEDHAGLGIYSNAQNFPGLLVYVCGRAVKAATGSAPALTCSDPGGQVAACHK